MPTRNFRSLGGPIATLCLGLCIAGAASAQEPGAILRGVVVDTLRQPIPFAQVTIRRAGMRVTDDSGRFQFAIPDIDEIELQVRRIGFRPVEHGFTEVPDTTIVLAMVQVAHSLPAVRADAEKTSRSLELHGFYQRLEEREKGLNSGWFVTPEDLEIRRPNRASYIVDGIPGVRLIRTNRRGNRFALVGNNNCPMTIYLDGIRLNQMGIARSPEDTHPDIDAVLTPTAVAGVEVYTRRSSVPREFAMLNGTCGVILFWTR